MVVSTYTNDLFVLLTGRNHTCDVSCCSSFSSIQSIEQLFITRDMGSDFDMDVYNKMITEVQANPKFAEYFSPGQ